jgi:hypothetical protein
LLQESSLHGRHIDLESVTCRDNPIETGEQVVRIRTVDCCIRVDCELIVIQFPITLNDYVLVRLFFSINIQTSDRRFSIEVIIILDEDDKDYLSLGITWVELNLVLPIRHIEYLYIKPASKAVERLIEAEAEVGPQIDSPNNRIVIAADTTILQNLKILPNLFHCILIQYP